MEREGENSNEEVAGKNSEYYLHQLEIVREEVAAHMKNSHGGIFASSCHRCLNGQQRIRNIEFLLEKARNREQSERNGVDPYQKPQGQY